MSERTFEAPAIPGLATPKATDARGRSLVGVVRAHPGISTAGALLVVSVALVRWANTRPGFDPYGWLVWGHQTLHWALNTNGAPSWKPLPYLLTVPYGITGHYAMWLWMVTSVAVSLSGVVFAARIAYRLTGASPERRYAAIAAGAFAGLGLLGIRDYSHYILSAQSDPMIVSLCLGAIDCHLSGRHRWAIVLGVLAALGRPEVWPFLGLYALWAGRAFPSMRVFIVATLTLIPLLWFGIPALTANSFFVAGNNALHSGRALHGHKVFGTIDRFLDLHALPLQLAAVLAAGIAIYRRDRVVMALAGGVIAWVVIEVAFAVHGWPGLSRYLFEPAGVMVVVAAVLVGRVLADSPRLPSWAGIALVAVLVGSLVPTVGSRVRAERKDLRHERDRTRQINRLGAVITALGGAARINACGASVTELEWQSIVAWYTGNNVSAIGFHASRSLKQHRRVVVFTPRGHGWTVRAYYPSGSNAAGCRALRASTRVT